MNEAKFLTGIFSVYDSERALDFNDSENYPIGLELIFTNDTTGKEFAQCFHKALAALPEEKGITYRVQGGNADPVRGYDCFFRDTDSLRRALADSFDGIGMYHEEEQRVIPRTALIDQARKIMATRQQAVTF